MISKSVHLLFHSNVGLVLSLIFVALIACIAIIALILGLCQGFTRVAESVQNGPEHWGHFPGIVHSHRGDDGLAGPTAPPCPGVVVGSLVRGNGPPLSARIGLSPVIPSR